MNLRIEMPLIDPASRSGTLVMWEKAEGDSIEFGDELCRVALDEFAYLTRTERASLLSRHRRTKVRSNVKTREGRWLVNFVLVASDRGVLRRIFKQSGDDLAIGDLLGVVSTEPHDPEADPDSLADLPVMRVVANIIGKPEHS